MINGLDTPWKNRASKLLGGTAGVEAMVGHGQQQQQQHNRCSHLKIMRPSSDNDGDVSHEFGRLTNPTPPSFYCFHIPLIVVVKVTRNAGDTQSGNQSFWLVIRLAVVAEGSSRDCWLMIESSHVPGVTKDLGGSEWLFHGTGSCY